MAGFELREDPQDTRVIECATSSIAVAHGDLLERVAGATTWTAATATSTHFSRKAVAIETITSAASAVKAILVNNDQIWAAEVTNTANATHNGDLMVLTDTNTVNNTGTTSTTEYATFMQTGITADARALGHILTLNGVDPDATV